MKIKLLVIGWGMLILAGCSPKTGGGDESSRTRMFDLKVEVNDRKMTLSWNRYREGAIAGYNIYITETSLAAKFPGPTIDLSITPVNSGPFPGDTNPDDGIEYYTSEGFENGVRYFVSVRVVYTDGSFSKPSREVEVVCGPRGEMELSIRYRSDQDGWSFDKNQYVRADAVSNDLYFFSKDGIDQLISPIRLDGFLNDTRLMVLPYKGSFDDVNRKIMATALTPTEDRVEVNAGDWVLLKVASERYALLQVLKLDGSGTARKAKLSFVYSTLVGEVFF